MFEMRMTIYQKMTVMNDQSISNDNNLLVSSKVEYDARIIDTSELEA